MTEFTKEWIAKARNACIFFGEPATTEFRKALDEIERLQAENEKLKSKATTNDFILLELNDMLKEKQQRVQELEHYEKLIQEWVRDKVEGLDNLEEIEKMVRLVDDINRKNAGVSCGWCNETFDTKDEIKQHALTCKDNPLAQRIAELEQERRWIPVSERLPEENVYVQVASSGDVFHAKMYLKYGEPKWVWQGYDVEFVTHWQPKPQPPKEVTK